jgi:two-component system chemotaxis sensor kinase CheA
MDMSQYLDLFLQEAEEQLEILEQETLKLEQDPTPDRLQVIFRAAHTLKGSSRAMGFSGFAGLTHEMENVLDQLRSGTLEVTTEIADALLACLDALGDLKTSIAAGQGDNGDCTVLVEKLQAFVGGAGEKPAVSAEPTRPATEPATPGAGADQGFPSKVDADTAEALLAATAEKPVWHARFRLRADCVMKFVRAFMAISIIQEQGELLACVPDRESLEEEKFETDFELLFQTAEDIEEIKTKLQAVGETEWCRVDAWAPADPDSAATESQVPPAEQAKEDSQPAAEALAAKPEAKDAPAAPATAAKKTESGQTVRVDVARLDELMNLVGELVIDRTRVAQIGAVLSGKYEYDDNVEALGETVSHIARITGDLQDQIMKARMLPIETVFNRFPRMVRDLAQKVGKDIKLEMLGGDTELDRSVIEVIGDPLIHILRNSVDHGIEAPEERAAAGKPADGHIVLSARHQENHIVIEITDDGKGIDLVKVRKKAVEKGLLAKDAAERITDKEAVQLIFASGLSTAQTVSDVSGRGVGMDIVKSNIQRLGGIIDVDTTLGAGTKFSLRLPLTLAIIRGLLVRIANVVYVVPLGSVIETLLVGKKEIQTVHKHEVIVIRGVTTPLVRMRNVFATRNAVEGEERACFYVVIVGLAEKRIGLVVDTLIGEQEVVIKSLSRFCGDVKGVSGATILGDGNVALIADVNGIIEQARSAA